MANILRALLGGALGAGEGYFRGQDMKRQMEEDTERRELNRRRVDMEEERLRDAQAREEAARRDGLTRQSNDIREKWNAHLKGGAVSDLVRQSLANPEDTSIRDRLMVMDPQRAGQVRTELRDREPPKVADRRAVNPATGEPFASEADYLRWKARDAAAGRMPREAAGESGPSKSEQDEAMQGLAILNSANQMDPETKRRFLQAFQQATAAYPGSAGRAAYRAWQGIRSVKAPPAVGGSAPPGYDP